MNKIKLTSIALASMAVMSVSTTASANNQQALAVVKNYASAIACSTSFESGMPNQTTLRDVYPISLQGTYGPTYMVVWSGDTSCKSSNGSYGVQFTVVSKDRAGRYSPNPSIPNVIQSVNSRGEVINEDFIENVSVRNNMVEIISSELDKSNPNVSLNYRYTVGYQGGSWKVANKQFLGREVD